MATVSEGDDAPARGIFHVSLTTTQTSMTSLTTPLAFDTVEINHYGDWDATNHRWVCPVSGYYYFYCMLQANANGDSPRPEIFKNGVVMCKGSYLGAGVSAGAAVIIPTLTTKFLLAGDLIDVRPYLPTGQTSVTGDPASTYFGGFKV